MSTVTTLSLLSPRKHWSADELGHLVHGIRQHCPHTDRAGNYEPLKPIASDKALNDLVRSSHDCRKPLFLGGRSPKLSASIFPGTHFNNAGCWITMESPEVGSAMSFAEQLRSEITCAALTVWPSCDEIRTRISYPHYHGLELGVTSTELREGIHVIPLLLYAHGNISARPDESLLLAHGFEVLCNERDRFHVRYTRASNAWSAAEFAEHTDLGLTGEAIFACQES